MIMTMPKIPRIYENNYPSRFDGCMGASSTPCSKNMQHFLVDTVHVLLRLDNKGHYWIRWWPMEKKNETEICREFFLHRLVYGLFSNNFAFMDIFGIYLYWGAETVLFQYSLDM